MTPTRAKDAAPADRAAYRANREVRHTIIRLISDHLRPDAALSWQGLNLDFTGVVFDGGDFARARFSGGIVRFDGAEFPGGELVNFLATEFSGGEVTSAQQRAGQDPRPVRRPQEPVPSACTTTRSE